MSLITCIECGKQFSDKAVACPNCGCPTEEVLKAGTNNNEELLDEIYSLHPDSKAYAIKEYMNRTGLSMKEAKKIIDEFYLSKQPAPTKFSNKYTNQFHNEKLAAAQEKALKDAEDAKITFRCPKCNGINIQVMDGKKKLSITKGLVGGLIGGPIGAVAGGAVLGKKGKYECICMNCGYKWKLK